MPLEFNEIMPHKFIKVYIAITSLHYWTILAGNTIQLTSCLTGLD
jgi:hypothetical protein